MLSPDALRGPVAPLRLLATAQPCPPPLSARPDPYRRSISANPVPADDDGVSGKRIHLHLFLVSAPRQRRVAAIAAAVAAAASAITSLLYRLGGLCLPVCPALPALPCPSSILSYPVALSLPSTHALFRNRSSRQHVPCRPVCGHITTSLPRPS